MKMNLKINDGAYKVPDPLEPHPCALIMPAMKEDVYEKLKEDISGNGLIEPIVLFQKKILDGIHRYKACKDLGIEVWAREWEGNMDPVEYVVSRNIHRRHLTDTQRATAAAKAIEYHAAQAKKRQKEHGGTSPGKPKSVSANLREVSEAGKAAGKVASLFDVPERAVEQVVYILKHGTEEEKFKLEKAAAKISPIEREVRERVKNAVPKAKAKFNSTTERIEWAKWSWNPVTGCKHGCKYCYAKDMANRYPDGFPNGFDPTFIEERLSAPLNTKPPKTKSEGDRNVFVCSMADLFGEWVPQEWIDKVIRACADSPQWTFIFLTKNPKRLLTIEWPDNAWVGTTVDCQKRVGPAVEVFSEFESMKQSGCCDAGSCPTVKFLSCEPLREPLDFGDDGLAMFDWVIIGGQSKTSGSPAMQPEWEWVEKLHNDAREAGCSVYWKPNLTVRPREYPRS